ncbi:MAG: tyrosine-type recombinase/integrase [Frankiaceae bacterium]|nr:tyrosine-type recombinase/integrase [Frankiaceae bacterium]MBV9869058.1 tyrosine-type recombinase/integrase [Frankiaceae bacterium]
MTTTDLSLTTSDASRWAVAGFLARYREPTRSAYTLDLRSFLAWCLSNNRDMLQVSRAELELFLRDMEGRGYAVATIARRFGTVATFYKYAVIDGLISHNPADAVTRPRVSWEGQRRTVLHPLEFAAMLTAARTAGPVEHALVALLGMLGLRVSEACNADVTDLRYESGYELLHIIGKGAKPADIPLPIPVLRAVRQVIGERTTGPLLRTRTGRRLDRPAAARIVARLAKHAGINHAISPHGLRRTFCTSGLIAGVAIRDMQHAMRHSDPRTTLRYDMAKTNLDRHASHAVAAYLAGMSTG